MDGVRVLLRSDWQGFPEVMDAMARELPDLRAERLGKVDLLKPGHALCRRGMRCAAGAGASPASRWGRTAC
jgi:hypothetical protein